MTEVKEPTAIQTIRRRLTAIIRRARKVPHPSKSHARAMSAKAYVYDRNGLYRVGAELLAACRHDGRDLNLAVFDFSDLLEVRKVYGRRISCALTRHSCAQLADAAGGKGLVACTGPGQFTLAIALERHQAMLAIQRVLGTPPHVELNVEGHELILVPNFLLGTVAAGESITDRYTVLCDRLRSMNAQEQLRLRYLRRSRERHSRPMSLEVSPGRRAAQPVSALASARPGRP